MSAHFEVFQSPSDESWRWRLLAANGEIVAQSEGYVSAQDAERGCEDAVKTAEAARFPAAGQSSIALDIRRSE